MASRGSFAVIFTVWRSTAPSPRWRSQIILIVLFTALMSGCESTPNLYEWGSYDQSVARLASESDGFDLPAEIARLSSEMRQIADAGRKVPPGFRIHLGYLYLLQGDKASAQELFEVEKILYPESRTFIDGLMARLSALSAPAAGRNN